MAAFNGTVLEPWIAPQNRVQSHLILTNKRISAVVLVPIARKGENLLQRYDKNSRFSVMMRRLLTTSSYSLDAKASRGGARIFYELAPILH
jgi:hypothetical protein